MPESDPNSESVNACSIFKISKNIHCHRYTSDLSVADMTYTHVVCYPKYPG